MNKRILGVFVSLFAIVMLATPMVGTVMAGKGQEKLDFRLHMVGIMMPPAEKGWYAGSTGHFRGLPWIVVGDFFIEIGEAGAVETIPKECLSYVGSLDGDGNLKQDLGLVRVRETITIYTDATQLTERGTIEILALGVNPAGNGAMVNGHGTGEFESVKIMGTTTAIPGPPGTIIRVGTVMGWPT